jgi:hypothetical protein
MIANGTKVKILAVGFGADVMAGHIGTVEEYTEKGEFFPYVVAFSGDQRISGYVGDGDQKRRYKETELEEQQDEKQ